MARKYMTPEEHLNRMKINEEGMRRIGPGRQGLIYMKKLKPTQGPSIIEAGQDPSERKSKVIMGKAHKKI